MKAVYLNADGSITPDKHEDSIVRIPNKWQFEQMMEEVEFTTKSKYYNLKHGISRSYEMCESIDSRFYEAVADGEATLSFDSFVYGSRVEADIRVKIIADGWIKTYYWPLLELKQAIK